MNLLRLLLLTASANDEGVLEMKNNTAPMDLSEEAKQAVEVLSEEMNSVHYIYDADFNDLEDLQDANAREELAE